MKIILKEAPHLGSKKRGIGVYTRELYHAFTKTIKNHQIVFASKKGQEAGADIIHYPFFDPFFLTLPAKLTKKTVITIHDLIPLRFPEHFKAGIRGKIKLLIQSYRARKASAIITDSEASKKDIISYLKIPKDKIHVIMLACTKEVVPKILAKKIVKKYKLPEKYILYVGDINWNKNVVGLIKTFNSLEDNSCHLVLVGKVFGDMPDIPEWHLIKKEIKASKRKDQIHLMGYVPSHHLPVFFTNATLYVQPSWYEGFGLPVLEAMSYGCPVATSSKGSLVEVGGSAVAYFDPGKNMKEVIDRLLLDVEERARLSGLGLARAKEFSWEKVAKETLDVYEKFLSDKNV